MARTIRRKKHTYARRTTKHDVLRAPSGAFYVVRRAQTEEEQRKFDVKFFSDNAKGECVPHQYINARYERPMRRKIAQLIHRAMKDPDYEVILPKAFKDAGYHYW